jgi:hypothetical protein
MNENRLQEYKCGCCKNATTSQKWIATPYYSEISSVAEKIYHIFHFRRNSHIISTIKAGR